MAWRRPCREPPPASPGSIGPHSSSAPRRRPRRALRRRPHRARRRCSRSCGRCRRCRRPRSPRWTKRPASKCGRGRRRLPPAACGAAAAHTANPSAPPSQRPRPRSRCCRRQACRPRTSPATPRWGPETTRSRPPRRPPTCCRRRHLTFQSPAHCWSATPAGVSRRWRPSICCKLRAVPAACHRPRRRSSAHTPSPTVPKPCHPWWAWGCSSHC
mmetsp:Transcript_47647/g.137112  ORF Transcript_47647/g.137112 Transcript_47647/m.137112 type:complete len:214 (+) Transcript_47647:123-764(+)